MLEALSPAYYLGRVLVEPHDGPHALLSRRQHRRAAETIYATGVGVERLDLPLVVKLDHQHLPVFAGGDLPTGTLAVPPSVLEASHVDNPPAVKEVLVATADRARQLLEWFTPYTVPSPAVT